MNPYRSRFHLQYSGVVINKYCNNSLSQHSEVFLSVLFRCPVLEPAENGYQSCALRYHTVKVCDQPFSSPLRPLEYGLVLAN